VAKSKLLNFKSLINFAVTALIAFLLWKVAKVDFHKSIEQISNTNLYFFSIALVFYLVQIFTNAERWLILLKVLDYKLSYWRALQLYFEGTFSNCFLPINVAGDALRAYKLGREHSDWMRAASTVLIERILGFTMMLTLIPVGLICLHLSLQKDLVPVQLQYSLLIAFLAMPAGYLSYALWSRIPLAIVAKLKYSIEIYLKHHRGIIKMIIWTIITHGFLILGNVFVAMSLSVGLDQIPLWYWLLLVPAASVAGFTVPSVKGLGAKEATYVYILGFIGITPDTALAIAVVAFSAYMITSIPGITIVWTYKAEKIASEEV
jgi:uncharacterized membrane protein YbhN (UPF0104 family)